MIILAFIVAGVACLALALQTLALHQSGKVLRSTQEALADERVVSRDLLDRLLSRNAADYLALQYARPVAEDVLAPEQPSAWMYDETGLIREPVFGDDGG